jgi:hypothetical protein
MNCQACRREIEESDGARTHTGSAGAHLETCAECRAFSNEQTALRRLIGSLEVVTAPADFDFRLRARLAGVKSEGARHGARLRFAPGAWSLALAASFVLLLSVGLIVRQAWLSPTLSTVAASRDFPMENRNLPSPARPEIIQAGPQNISASDNTGVQRQAVAQRTRSFDNVLTPPTATSGNEGAGSNEFVVRGATASITPPGIPDPLTQPGAIIAVPVQASRKSPTVTLSYQSARPQTVSLRPVTFGAQEVFEQGEAQQTLLSSAQGVW